MLSLAPGTFLACPGTLCAIGGDDVRLLEGALLPSPHHCHLRSELNMLLPPCPPLLDPSRHGFKRIQIQT